MQQNVEKRGGRDKKLKQFYGGGEKAYKIRVCWFLDGNHSLEKVVIGPNIHSLENNLFFSDINLKEVIIKGDISATSNIADIFTNITSSITLYGNETVQNFVQRYNENTPNHQLIYSQLDNII